ncbi:DUF2878 domain-containing protein [Methylotenera sp. L2L1]|uniref:DUF2878 domain-containing protein n=1 Tax=Methylotenera sp. L2L1 TaxID=1502770 RepID=UPI000566DF87|nr:DUF2878 domain-containing protein [Methylotenera sp. L2L1]
MLVLNFILFQIAWFACVLGTANAMPWLGVLITAVILTWHLCKSKNVKNELKLLMYTVVIGAFLDQALLSFNLVNYLHHGWHQSIVPVWILALWLAFGTTLNMSLAWMQKRYYVSIIFGMIGGPLAYLAAEKLGAVTITGQLSFVVLAIGWATITPTLLYIARRVNTIKR